MRRIFLTALVFLLLTGAASARTLPALKPIVTSYDVYVGGIHFLTASILFQQDRGKYRARVRGSTHGFWYRIVPWNTELEAEGRIRQGQLVPAKFATRDVWDHKPKTTRMRFDGKGGVSTEFDPPRRGKSPEFVTEEQRRGALDPVTALLQMLAHVAIEEDCSLKVPVFDGKRRFDLDGADMGMAELDGDDYGIYSGPARACDVSFTMIAGDWQEQKKARFWQNERGETGREPFHIWLANPAPGLPELPVRLETGSAWGTIVFHLADWHYASSDEIKSKPAESGG